MRPNQVRAKLASGEICAGPFVFLADAHVMGTAAAVGFDFACVCLEHGRASFETLQTMVWAADAAGITPFARLSDVSRQSVLRTLETGVQGILLPWCQDAAMARTLVDHARYLPAGQRGQYGMAYGTDYLRTPLRDHFAIANAEVLVMAQIESAEALDQVEAIAAVEGLDALMVGPGDLSLQLGHFLEFDHPTVRGAIDRVVDACLAAGKQPALLDMNPAFTDRYMERGVKLWWWGQDLNLMRLQMLAEARRLTTRYGWQANPGRQPGRPLAEQD